MIRGILIGLDGSPYSRAAVNLGINWSREFDSTLIGLTIVNRRVAEKPPAEPFWYAKEFVDETAHVRLAEAKERQRPYVEEFTRSCGRARVGCDVVEDVGRPADQVLLEAQRTDLILLGQHTYFHTGEHDDREGSLLRKVLRQAPRPVVITPKESSKSGCVVVACDGSPQAARALFAFQASGLAFADQVHVLSVAETERDSRCPAYRATEFLGRHNIHAKALTIVTGDSPAKVILQQCRELGARLLVLGVLGTPRLQEVLIGSVTHEILHAQDIPPLFLFH